MVSMGSARRASFFDSAQENGILTESHELLGPASVPVSRTWYFDPLRASEGFAACPASRVMPPSDEMHSTAEVFA